MKVGLLLDIRPDNYKAQITHAKSLGFDRAQFCIWDMDFYTKENAAALKRTLQEEHFKADSLWCGWSGPTLWSYPEMYQSLGLVPDWLREKRLEELRRGGQFAYDLDVDTIATHTGYLPDDPRHPTHIAIRMGLSQLCAELQSRGQRFAFETGEELPLTLSLLITEIGLDNVGINFDPANFLTNGRANPNDAMDLLGCRIFGMHAKDAIPPKFGQPKGKQTPLGEGAVDFRRLLCQLKDNGYTGDIMIEHEMGDRLDRDADLLRSKAYLEDLIAQVYDT